MVIWPGRRRLLSLEGDVSYVARMKDVCHLSWQAQNLGAPVHYLLKFAQIAGAHNGVFNQNARQ